MRNKGLTKAQEVRKEKALNKLYNFNGETTSFKTRIDRGDYVRSEVKEVSRYKWNRRKFNQMSQREQIEYEKKMKLKKVEYRLYTGEDTINDVGEWIYDYFNNKTKAKAKPMITVNNYNTEKSKINWNELPSNIRELRTDVEGIMEFYNDDESIKETVDIFIKKLNAANKPKSKPPAPKKKEPRPKKPTPKKSAPKKQQTTSAFEMVDNFSKEFMLIRRFYNLVSKKQTASFRSIQLLYMAFEKAIVGRNVRKKSENAALFTKVNAKLVKLYKSVKEGEFNAKITFTDSKLLLEMEKFVKGKKVNAAITLLNSYIGMQGYKPEKEKAERLMKRIESAISKGRISKGNRLYELLLDAKKELKSYIKNPNEKIDAEAFGLSRPGVCENRVKCEGLTKSGQLKRGYKFAGGGAVVRVSGKKD